MRFIIFLCAFFKIGFICGQKQFNVQLAFDYGTLSVPKGDTSKNISGVSLDISKFTIGKKYWQADHNYPQMGITLNVRNLHNYKSLSHVFSVIPYLEFNLIHTPSGTFQLKHGTGFAWFTGNLNSVIEQPIGSRLNAASFIDVGYEFNCGRFLKLKPGISLFHQSNGNIFLPNKGLNSVAIYLQGRFYQDRALVKIKHKNTTDTLSPWHPELRVSLGLSQYNKVQNKFAVNYQVLGMIGFQHSTILRTNAGLELLFFSNESYPVSSFYIEENVLFGHLITKYGIGIYLNENGLNQGRLYEKVGIAYFPLKLKNHVGKGLNIGTAIKAHGFKAANIDLSLGYIF